MKACPVLARCFQLKCLLVRMGKAGGDRYVVGRGDGRQAETRKVKNHFGEAGRRESQVKIWCQNLSIAGDERFAGWSKEYRGRLRLYSGEVRDEHIFSLVRIGRDQAE